MVDAIAEALTRAVATGFWLAPLVALVGGAMTAANPCVLGMVPVMVKPPCFRMRLASARK